MEIVNTGSKMERRRLVAQMFNGILLVGKMSASRRRAIDVLMDGVTMRVCWLQRQPENGFVAGLGFCDEPSSLQF